MPTRVTIRFNVSEAKWLSDEVKAKVIQRWGHDLSREGDMIVVSGRTRNQFLNQVSRFYIQQRENRKTEVVSISGRRDEEAAGSDLDLAVSPAENQG